MLLLVGCSSSNNTVDVEQEAKSTDNGEEIVSEDNNSNVDTDDVTIENETEEENTIEKEEEEENIIVDEEVEIADMNEKQKNSLSMLNYLTSLTQEINSYRNNKFYLEEAFSSLINNTYANAIDDRTQTELDCLLDTIEQFRMIDVKRERLQFLFEQAQAQAVRDAVPNPLGLLSAVSSLDWKKLAASVTYMAIDAIASYESSNAKAELEFIQKNYELDNQAAAYLSQSRKNMFDYGIDMCQEYNLDSDLALSESNVEKFVAWKNNENVIGRLQFLETYQDTFQNFGEYWLLLARSYYEDERYEDCLNAIDQYELKQARIFKKDHDYAYTLPIAIVSLNEIGKSSPDYENKLRNYAEKIVNNLEMEEDWNVRYFAAETYLSLYALSDDVHDLEKAYSLAVENINFMINDQKSMNSTYMADIKEKAIPKDVDKETKEEIKEYNKKIKEERKTELPPVYEPLYLNCDLAYAILNNYEDILTDYQVKRDMLDRNLHGTNASIVFLNEPLDNLYRNNSINTDYTIELSKGELIVPATIVTENSIIKLVITSLDGNKTIIEDWSIKEVKRDKGNNIENFIAHYSSKNGKNYSYSDGEKLELIITPIEGSYASDIVLSYNVKTKKSMLVLNTIYFEKA